MKSVIAESRGACTQTGLYYERLNGGGPAILWIHGGGATGACFRGDLDGNAGWADMAADRGFDCWVTDWPGTGRSGRLDPIDLGYAEVVAAYRTFLRSTVGRPSIVVCHSMGGAIAWQLVEHETDMLRGVVSVAGAYPGNEAPRATVHSDDGRVVDATFEDTGLRLEVDRERLYYYGHGYIDLQAFGTSTRLDRARLDDITARFSGLPPKMLLQRIGAEPGLPRVDDPSGFVGMPIRLIAGPEDAAHPLDIESRTVDVLTEWGADAELVWLSARGIDGNGHFLFWEDNAAQIGDILIDTIVGIDRGRAAG